MKRPTIRDIAAAAGVSPGAVSFALNDRPGVSDETRERIRAVANELGWIPSAAARALSVNRAQAVGLVIARPSDSISNEGFYLRFIAGVEEVLTASSLSLVLQLVATVHEEQEVYQSWWSGRKVDGVLLTDPRQDDPRPAQLTDLGLPAVMVGAPQGAFASYPAIGTISTDDATAMRGVVEHLRQIGRRRFAYIGGMAGLVHLDARRAAFSEAVGDFDLPVPTSVTTDFTEDAGRKQTRNLLAGDPRQRPDAIVYDNELLALGGLVAIHDLGLRAPEDVAIVSFEDSPVCRVVNPPLTALQRDPADLGRDATANLLAALSADDAVGHRTAPAPLLQIRSSTVPASNETR